MTTKRVLNQRFWSNSGDRIKPKYSSRFDDDGILVLDIVGETDIYLDIQSWAESVDINNIMKRYQDGDSDALNAVQGFFADTSNFPTDFIGCMNLMNSTEQLFDNLPVELKSSYGNDYHQFLASYDAKDFEFRVNSLFNNVENNVNDEVISDESE